ncbi:hypothetical protein TSUD_306520 [Trifolium subterraneum]|uniref:Uncharacterized protein n=1 Tax=Trifolium subterraneum TaxID=3900 RepID=A0A2Z6NUH4_TRISU|nr:hypothetical protein TSUD_306520 [Trifolium subterraneum]
MERKMVSILSGPVITSLFMKEKANGRRPRDDEAWNNRNNYVWNDSRVNARHIGYQVRQLWNERAVVNSAADTHQQLQNMAVVAHWQPPVQGRLKCNVDASFYDAEGVTVRDGAFVIIMVLLLLQVPISIIKD